MVVNPVNGAGLFQYLEAFFENGIAFRTFAVAPLRCVKTNSGIAFETDDTVADLKGHEQEYDAVVFACGDAMPRFAQEASLAYNVDLMTVLGRFAALGKIVAGHCVGGLLFDSLPAAQNHRVALHPFVKGMVKSVAATDAAFEVDGNFYTARTENTLSQLLPHLLERLK